MNSSCNSKEFNFDFSLAHFCEVSPDQAKELFKSSVHGVHIELFNYCNRTCWFCENSGIDRRTFKYLDKSTLNSILEQLAEIDYDKFLTFHNYNEPMADIDCLIEATKLTRKKLPNCKIFIYSNGDFATQEKLEKLQDAGMNFIHISIYPMTKQQRFSEERALKLMKKFAQRINGTIEVSRKDNLMVIGTIQSPYLSSLEIDIHARDMDHLGFKVAYDQSQLCHREAPCIRPFYQFAVNYDGTVSHCTMINPDLPEHRRQLVGNINKSNIFEIYTNKLMQEKKRNLISFERKFGQCEFCDFPAQQNNNYYNDDGRNDFDKIVIRKKKSSSLDHKI